MKLQDYLNKSKSNILMSDFISVDLTDELKRLDEIKKTIESATCSPCAKGKYQTEITKIERDLAQYEADRVTIKAHIKQINLKEQTFEKLKIIAKFYDIPLAKTKDKMVLAIETKSK